jgi:membrane protein implicated in regulation of membrane protease activity
MSSRSSAWLIFLAVITLLALAAGSPGANLMLKYGVWAILLSIAVLFLWSYAHAPSPSDRHRLIDSRGISLVSRSVRRWLFGDR